MLFSSRHFHFISKQGANFPSAPVFNSFYLIFFVAAVVSAVAEESSEEIVIRLFVHGRTIAGRASVAVEAAFFASAAVTVITAAPAAILSVAAETVAIAPIETSAASAVSVAVALVVACVQRGAVVLNAHGNNHDIARGFFPSLSVVTSLFSERAA